MSRPRRPVFEHARETHAHDRFAAVTLAVIVVGGAVGAASRYGIEHLNPDGSDAFPTGTFVANVTGAFGLGLLLAALDRVHSAWFVKPMIATGFFGAYTTFSTFAVEIVTRIKDDHVALAVGYAVVTLAVGLLLATVGHVLGNRFPADGEVNRA